MTIDKIIADKRSAGKMIKKENGCRQNDCGQNDRRRDDS